MIAFAIESACCAWLARRGRGRAGRNPVCLMPGQSWILMGMPPMEARQPRAARAGSALAALSLMILSAGCASGGSAGPGHDTRALAASYLAIAVPANYRLEIEVDRFKEHERDNLSAAETDLRAQSATERWFDRRLMKIPFPPRMAAVARALVRANQSRVRLTERQARSTSIARLRSYTGQHQAADAAVEVQVKVIRRDLGLPAPSTS
jgi:hypothetical protein